MCVKVGRGDQNEEGLTRLGRGRTLSVLPVLLLLLPLPFARFHCLWFGLGWAGSDQDGEEAVGQSRSAAPSGGRAQAGRAGEHATRVSTTGLVLTEAASHLWCRLWRRSTTASCARKTQTFAELSRRQSKDSMTYRDAGQ